MAVDIIDYEIKGESLQLVEIELDPQEGVRAEAGAMTYMEQGIEMQTTTAGGAWKGFKRMLTGASFFITTFLNQGTTKARVAFAAPYPGQVITLNLTELGGEFLCQSSSFLCAANGIDIEVAFTKKVGAGFFGGEGFILQKLQGNGLAFVHAGGTIISKNLAPGEELRVDTGSVVGFSTSVEYDIQMVGGIKDALFAGEGLFLTKLTGPGLVYLQSLPLSKLAKKISGAVVKTS
ncbi:MAG: TIGR00266 family protein [Microcoleaceae cyanobacterium]